MIEYFLLEQPKSILFGPGMRKEVPGLLKSYGKRVLLLSGKRWFSRSGWQERFTSLLSGLEVLHIACPSGEPTSEGIEEVLNRARAFAPEAILAVGGGSVLDTAKAAAGLLPLKEKVDDFLEGVGRGIRINAPGIPWIAIPTTSGTGAEVTRNAVVKSVRLGFKKSIRSPFLLAACAVIDPELTLDCPLGITGTAGLDALTQLIESFISRKAKPVPRALVRDAFPVMLSALKAIPENPADLPARTGAAYGAMISGIALANSGLGAAHGFASGLGGMYDVPHGLICALTLRPVLELNAEVIGKDLEILCREAARASSGRKAGAGKRSPGSGARRPLARPSMAAAARRPPCLRPGPGKDSLKWLLEEIEGLFSLYSLPRDLKAYSIDPAAVPEIVRRSSGSSMSGNPRELSIVSMEKLISSLI